MVRHELIALRPLSKAPDLKLQVLEPLVECGFPLPYEGENIFRPAIDIGIELAPNPVTTFVATAWSDSMEPLVHQGDTLLVDRSLPVRNGNYIAGVINGGWFMKRFWQQNGRIELHSENPKYEIIIVQEYMNYRLFGRIYRVIQSV